LATTSLLLHAAHADVKVTNIADNATLRYPVALLEGSSDAPENTRLTVINRNSKKSSRRFETLTVGGRFKALAELRPGRNTIELSDGQKSQIFHLKYEPMTTPYIVRMIYLTDETGETKYATPKANDPQDYKAKLDTVAKLMQTATAESLNAAGLGRKTFRLETDAAGDVVIHTVKANRPGSYYQGIADDQQLYREINEFLQPEFPTAQAKNVVLMGFSKYDAVNRKPLSHTALGGGGQGLFGSLNLFSWPSTLQELQPIFRDNTPIDPATAFDDSGGRHRMWGLAATTIGATLHELGHALGLPHSPVRTSVMSRGFDQINRMFILTEPARAADQPPLRPKPEEAANFDRVSSERLAYTHWFEMDRKKTNKLPAPSAQVNGETGQVSIFAPAGLRFVGIDRDSLTRDSQVYPTKAPTSAQFTRDELAKRAGGEGFSMLLIDDNGNQTSVDAAKFANPATFIRGWKLSPTPLSWPDTRQLPQFDAQTIDQLSALPRQKSATAYIDLLAHYKATGKVDNQRAFALAEINSDREQSVLLLTGSDDALRVWLNGQLLLTKNTMRGASPDSDATPITLRAGKNTLLLEVLNGSEDWGFFARLAAADAARTPLMVDELGHVTAQ
jgi:hypothetical protein